ncbi:STN domain-containing protein [Halosquirtibacter laminarini]|uniref:STN domain-containing protein n=1 Tax=Halosquirtibacter laminarini TaxID=3374600 RepID=A0AC61NHJ6_9BACT|nr:STN domain-containing protein [Prolixibacteraceae bacterium]
MVIPKDSQKPLSISDKLNIVLKGTDLSFKIKGEVVVISKKRQRRHATLGYLTPLEFGKQKYFNVA